MLSRIVVTTCLALFLCPPAQGDRWALLVGIDKYDSEEISELKYAGKDVKAFAEVLTDPAICGFPQDHVLLMTNESRGKDRPRAVNIILRLDGLARVIKPEDTFVFYFTGHGITSGTTAYLLGVDTVPVTPETLQQTALPLTRLQSRLSKIRARQLLFICDCCRNDPEKGKGNGGNALTDELARGIRVETRSTAMELPSVTATLYACSLGQRAYEWPEKQHGVFSYYLLEGLKGKAADAQGRSTIAGLAQYVQTETAKWCKREWAGRVKQTPWLRQEGGGELVLALARRRPPLPAVKPEAISLKGTLIVKSPVDGVISIDGGQGHPIERGKALQYHLGVGRHLLRFIRGKTKEWEELVDVWEGETVTAVADIPLFPVTQNGQGGYIDRTGNMVIQPRFVWNDFFYEGLAGVIVGDKAGFIDKTGAIVIEPQPHVVRSFSEGRAAVEVGNRCGYIDRTGAMVIPPKFDIALPFSEGLAQVAIRDDGIMKWGFVMKDGSMAIQPQFDVTSPFREGLALARLGDRLGHINRMGEVVISLQGLCAGAFTEGLASAIGGRAFGYIDKTGKFVIRPRFFHAQHFREGLAAVTISSRGTGKWGFIDKTGEMVIKPRFDDVHPFSEGRAAVLIGDRETGEWGFIDKTGTMVIAPQFCGSPYPFKEGLAQVHLRSELGLKYGYIDKTGKFVWGPM